MQAFKYFYNLKIKIKKNKKNNNNTVIIQKGKTSNYSSDQCINDSAFEGQDYGKISQKEKRT